MKQRALILRIEGSVAHLRCPDETCKTCTGQVCAPTNRDIRALIPPGVDAGPDDWVEVTYSSRRAAIDFVVVLGLPVLGFVLGYLVGPVLFPKIVDSAADVVRVLSGLVGGVVGAMFPVLRWRYAPKSGLPIVSRVLRKRDRHTETPSETRLQPDA